MVKAKDMLDSQVNIVEDKLKKEYMCDHILLVSGLSDIILERFILKCIMKSMHILVIEDKSYICNVLDNYHYAYETFKLNNDYSCYDYIFINTLDHNKIKEILNRVNLNKIILLNMEKLKDININYNKLLLGVGFLVPFISFYTDVNLIIDDFDTNISLQYHNLLAFNKKENA